MEQQVAGGRKEAATGLQPRRNKGANH